jgi:hypothetical protein
MGMADVATVLWTEVPQVRREPPDWADRDRFVLSAGHGSMLIYSLLHLTGYKAVTMDEMSQLPPVGRRPPATRSSATRRASRRPPARWARASPRRRHGHGRAPSERRATATPWSTTAPGSSPATAA